jgi:hypothetical protein
VSRSFEEKDDGGNLEALRAVIGSWVICYWLWVKGYRFFRVGSWVFRHSPKLDVEPISGI